MRHVIARLCAELMRHRDLRHLCRSLAHWIHRHEHWAHTHLHTVYFGLVAIEAHGHYGKAAGLLFVLSIVAAFNGDDPE